jgi:predicted O-methyltransferase YrrM
VRHPRSEGLLDAARRAYRAVVPLRARRWVRALGTRPPFPGDAPYVTDWMAAAVRSGVFLEHFQRWEALGFHVTPAHYYQPIPDSRELPESLWSKRYDMVGVDMNEAFQVHLVREVFPRYREEYRQFAATKTPVPHEYYQDNGYFIGADAPVLHCMVRHFKPRRIIEIGSGFSTMVAAAAALRNGSTEVIAIEPHPSDALRRGFPGLTRLLRSRVEDVDRGLFATLGENDILFIDSSHVVRTGGDVNLIYLELLPRLRDGVLVHVHDVFLPAEYPREQLIDKRLFWTEQYLLHAFLAFNTAFRVVWGTAMMLDRHREAMEAAFPHVPWPGGASFWMQRVPATAGPRPAE